MAYLSESALAEAPYRERLWGQLMLALYRSGRQAEALAAYGRARAGLVDELGIEPGPALQQLEQDILRQAPHLTAAPPVGGASVGGTSVGGTSVGGTSVGGTSAGGASAGGALAPTSPVVAPAAPTAEPVHPGVPDVSEMSGTASQSVRGQETTGRDVADDGGLVGRDAELRTVDELLAGTATGRGRLLLVSGSPGIGKSALLRELSARRHRPRRHRHRRRR